MPKASEVAAELRTLADRLEQQPDTNIAKARIGFWYDTQKQMFLDTVKALPRPLTKKYPKEPGRFERIYVEHTTESVELFATIYQSGVCRIIEPAKPAVYDCEPLLSADEETQIGGAA